MATTLADRSPLPRRLTHQRKKRRGIVLLMVVSLLALFLLMGVTFAILAIQYNTTAHTLAGLERYGDDPVVELEAGLGAVLFDTNTRSAAQGHSLLRDLYGTDYVLGTVLNAPLNDNRKTVNDNFVVFAMSTRPSDYPGFYNGRVITFITGAAAGLSSRVAGYEPFDPGTSRTELYIEPLPSNGENKVLPSNGDQFVINGAPFNGMGFGYCPESFRLDAVSGGRPVVLLPHYAGYTDRQAYSSVSGNAIAPDFGGADEPYDSPGLQDPHLATMPPGLLAAQMGGSSNRFSVPLIPSFQPAALQNYWLESTRWPFASGIKLTDPTQKDFARQIIFRPMPWDHPNFTGSNPDLTPAGQNDNAYEALIRRMAQQTAIPPSQPNQPPPYWEAIWDIDNDGDGVRDSVWIDIGLPVMTSPTGRKYKRLFAFLIKDLDGRINLNVHGNLAHGNVSSQTSINYPFPVFGPNVQPAAATFPANKNSAGAPIGSLQLPRGMGFGPAEVDFRYLLNVASLTADYGTIVTTRYGNDGVPGVSGDDSLSVVKMAGVPANYLNDSWYGSLPDVWGRNAVAVDFGGRPFFYRESISASGETIDDPYEMQWDHRTARDSNSDGYPDDTPYTPGDMERIARANDEDIQRFPMLLPTVAPNLFANAGQPSASGGVHQRVREAVTTMSSSVPTVPGIFRYEDRAFHTSGLSATDGPSVINIYRRKLAANGITNPTQVRTQLAKMMPWEFWQGKPLDLNRYLHNGVNDNNGTNLANGEAQEAIAGEPAFGTNTNIPSGGSLPTAGANFSGIRGYHANSIDVDNDGAQDGTTAATMDRYYARHLMARHLYCLMMALSGTGYNPPNSRGVGSQAATARLYAQWAVNIVDFRDTDGIMTGFEYDINPWNGWSTDGNLDTRGEPERDVVWGCEAPELLLTEAVGFHDRRVKDTKFDTTGKDRSEMNNRDPTLDQFRIPQGSLFFELYCPRTHGLYNATGGESIYNPHMPFELYDRTTGKLALDRTTNAGHPVWQVAIRRLRRDGEDTDGMPQYQIQNTNWDNASYSDPENMALMGQPTYNMQYDSSAAGRTIPIERYVWFTNTDGNAWGNPKRDHLFYNADGYTPQIAPGQYMVVGPRETTYLGSNRVAAGAQTSGFWQGNSRQRITLSKTTGVEIMDSTGATTSKLSTPPGGAQIQPVAAMAVMTRPPENWTQQKKNDPHKYWPGLNVTEPLPQSTSPAYYSQYDTMDTGWVPFDAYDDPQTPQNILPNQPMDNNKTLGQAGMLASRDYPQRSAVFLQRLADPTRDWNPLNNPYITIDFAPVDVTVFTGEENTDRQIQPDPNDPAKEDLDPDDPPGGRPNKFVTTQRGNAKGNVWFPRFTDTNLTNPNPGTASEPYFRISLHHTFGYLNEDLGTPRDATVSGGAYAGDPSNTNNDKPFPWITWNNRPYMNASELLLVPASAPNRLVLEISPDNPVLPSAPAGDPYNNNASNLRKPFAHLMNMFQSSTNDAGSMNLSRLLDFVEVPSNFVGAERWYNPNALSNTDSPAPTALRPEYVPPYLYRPPFNKLSRFRDPGKINLNTMFDPAIWSSIVGYDATNINALSGARTTSVNEVFASRQGYQGPIGFLNSAYPTLFANPFRPADTADLMPNAGSPNMRATRPVDVGLFRSSQTRTGEPLFGMEGSTTIQDANNSDRNAYFRYQALQKLPNIVGTQSNCYAVWVTVGYFEVEPAGVTASCPDGFQLGQELDIDQGKAQRHRGFYLIDRSIPVGFVPGLKLNTDNCVLLKRQID